MPRAEPVGEAKYSPASSGKLTRQIPQAISGVCRNRLVFWDSWILGFAFLSVLWSFQKFCNTGSATTRNGKGDSPLLCAAPCGPFRPPVAIPFSSRNTLGILQFIWNGPYPPNSRRVYHEEQEKHGAWKIAGCSSLTIRCATYLVCGVSE